MDTTPFPVDNWYNPFPRWISFGHLVRAVGEGLNWRLGYDLPRPHQAFDPHQADRLLLSIYSADAFSATSDGLFTIHLSARITLAPLKMRAILRVLAWADRFATIPTRVVIMEDDESAGDGSSGSMMEALMQVTGRGGYTFSWPEVIQRDIKNILDKRKTSNKLEPH